MSCGWFVFTCINCCRAHLIDYSTLIEVAKEHNLEVNRELENFKGYEIVIKCPKDDNNYSSETYRPDQLRFVIGDQSDHLFYEVIEKNNIYIKKA